MAVLSAGSISDTTMSAASLKQIRVPCSGRGRPRTRPTASSRTGATSQKPTANWLADRGIKAATLEKSDQAANRKRKGSAGGRPPTFDRDAYKGRSVLIRGVNQLKSDGVSL